MNQKTKTILKSMFVLAMVALSAHAFAIWSPAPPNPPSNNADVPINVGTNPQQKNGVIGVNGFKSFGVVQIDQATGGYLQFIGANDIHGSTCSGGDGVQEYDSTTQTMEYCNATSWVDMSGGCTGGGSQWTGTDPIS